MILYSAEKHACYDTALNYKEIPSDAKEISSDEHKLFMGVDIENGKQLVKNKYPFEFDDIPEPTVSELALSQISILESKQTPRRLREAALGDADSIAFLQDIDDQISELRKSLST